MLYTKAMIEKLRSLDEDTMKLFTHYLDNFFITKEEPQFKNYDLKKLWVLLLMDGLANELKNGSKKVLAEKYLTKLLNYNAKMFENKNFEPKTISNVESKFKFIKFTDNNVIIEDEQAQRHIPIKFVMEWSKLLRKKWDVDYTYELYTSWMYELEKKKPIKEVKNV